MVKIISGGSSTKIIFLCALNLVTHQVKDWFTPKTTHLVDNYEVDE